MSAGKPEVKHAAGEAKSEVPLILFTTCTPAAVGVTAIGLFSGASYLMAAVALGLAVVGMVASVAHLARPLRAARSISHLRSSWLSREIVAVSLFACAVLAWGAASLFADQLVILRYALNAVALIVGCALIAAIAKAYALRGQPAWNGSDTLVEIIAVACMLGGAVSLLALIVINALPIMGVPFDIAPIVYMLLPFAWLVAVALTCTGMLCCHVSWRMRAQRAAVLADEEEPRPRAVAASQSINRARAQLRRVLAPLFIIAALLAIASVVLAFWAWSERVEYALAPNIAALSCAALCLILCAAASFHLRNSFYHLADTGRFAVRLHQW